MRHLPNLITLTRIPLAAVPWIFPRDLVALAAAVLGAAFTDQLDGWIARRYGVVSRTGMWLDPLCDKTFVISTFIAIWVGWALPLWVAPLILAREILLALFALFVRMEARAAVPGKIATCAQFLSFPVLIFAREWTLPVAIVTALLGAYAAVFYFMRARKRRPRSAGRAGGTPGTTSARSPRASPH